MADQILGELDMASIAINSSTLHPVKQGSFSFFPNAIAKSRSACRLALSELILSICRDYLKQDFSLVNNRLVRACGSMYMPWHTDNNVMSGQRFRGKHNLPGVQFVLYLSDSHLAPFQLIQNSEKWSLGWPHRYLDNATAEKDFNEYIVEISPSKGTLLALNTHLFHRGVGFKKKDFIRSLLLFQFDVISDDLKDHGEQLLLNPSFIEDFDLSLVKILGLGKPRAYSAFPETSLEDIPPLESISIQVKLLSSLFSNILGSVTKTFFSDRLRVFIKNKRSQRLKI
ncbi:hypothetical protein [Synechococcus sp. CS-1332]|uniref:hypothetical protein n=1 Tax=Synechococcus sp. CS-1332 TaxID=2847972 RepID=UPI00223A8450|nr:hypothetical protein [Synechococcus sp. CS-1332]